ncbi:hypothetical protein GCM10027059_19450 [Myceligenerans halotolerans]
MTGRKLRPGELGEVSYREIPLKGGRARAKSVWQARVRVCLFDGRAASFPGAFSWPVVARVGADP